MHGAFYALLRAYVRACTRAPSILRNADWRMHAYTLRVRFPRCETCPRAPPLGSGKTAGSLLSPLFFFSCLPRVITCARIKEPLIEFFFGTDTNARAHVSWVALKFVFVFLTLSERLKWFIVIFSYRKMSVGIYNSDVIFTEKVSVMIFKNMRDIRGFWKY